MFKVPEKYRNRTHPLFGSDASIGNSGLFEIPLEEGLAVCIVSEGVEPPYDWEHISVHMIVDGQDETPTWDEMCQIKALFWSDEDCVVQFHPPKSQYVNRHQHTLHLWRQVGKNFPTPPMIMV